MYMGKDKDGRYNFIDTGRFIMSKEFIENKAISIDKSFDEDKAFEIYKEHNGEITNRKIAELLGEDEKVIAVWKNRDKWNVVQQSEKQSCTTKKKGGQPGNKNASGHGAPKKNSNAEKHGLFRKYLPEETLSIIEEMPDDSLDVLWNQIQIAYAAIMRSQQIMYVRDRNDKTIEKVAEQDGNVIGEFIFGNG